MDLESLTEVQEWVGDPSDIPPSLMEITIRLEVEVEQRQSVEAVFSLPHQYPRSCLPEVYVRQVTLMYIVLKIIVNVRSDNLNRSQQSLVNKEMQRFLETEVIPEVTNCEV